MRPASLLFLIGLLALAVSGIAVAGGPAEAGIIVTEGRIAMDGDDVTPMSAVATESCDDPRKHVAGAVSTKANVPGNPIDPEGGAAASGGDDDGDEGDDEEEGGDGHDDGGASASPGTRPAPAPGGGKPPAGSASTGSHDAHDDGTDHEDCLEDLDHDPEGYECRDLGGGVQLCVPDHGTGASPGAGGGQTFTLSEVGDDDGTGGPAAGGDEIAGCRGASGRSSGPSSGMLALLALLGGALVLRRRAAGA